MKTLYREITPLSKDDCFLVVSRDKTEFDFPLHCHEEYELNFIRGAQGAKRIVGYHMAEIGNSELVLVGGNLPHAWFNHHHQGGQIREIMVQFHKDLFDEKLLNRNQLSTIKSLLEKSVQGILFSQAAIERIAPRMEALTSLRGLESVLELMSILQELSVSTNMTVLSVATPQEGHPDFKSGRIEKFFDFIRNNYDKSISLKDVAGQVNMPEVSFSRFVRKRTGRTFIENLNEIRLGHATRLLINTTYTIAEISYRCGFNNLSYFNRVFKHKNGCTTSEYRVNYEGSKVII
jgi:AraC-like DNA-binding protein